MGKSCFGIVDNASTVASFVNPANLADLTNPANAANAKNHFPFSSDGCTADQKTLFLAFPGSALSSAVPSSRICHQGGSGMILPWSSANDGQFDGEAQVGRGILWVCVLLWFFLAVAIASDAFMAGIERITSAKHRVKNPSDPAKMITVHSWNDTVANLTLMAFGSSTPEILLSIIELVSNEFYSGDLGASTIVGSAAFNLFVIIAVCISSIPDGEYKRIAELNVYVVTAVGSLFAYFWMIVTLMLISPNIVDVWEGLVTFCMFPVLVYVAYLADQGFFSKEKKSAEYRVSYDGLSMEEIAEFATVLKAKYGKELPDHKIVQLLEAQLAPAKNRMTYRANAVRGLTGGSRGATKDGGPRRKSTLFGAGGNQEMKDDPECPEIFFDVVGNSVTCLECIGTLYVEVKCMPTNKPVNVPWKCVPGSAKPGTEYKDSSGVLVFPKSEEEQSLMCAIPIVDDEEQEDEMEFYIELSPDGGKYEILGERCTVTIVDDDEPGVISFANEEFVCAPADKTHRMNIQRRKGASGKVTAQWYLEEATARAGIDYEEQEKQTVVFEDQEAETQTIEFTTILAPKANQAGREFRIVMCDPTGGATFPVETDGGAQQNICTVVFNPEAVDTALLQRAKSSLQFSWQAAKLGRGSYFEQFVEAWYVNGSAEEQKNAGAIDWAMHILCLPWKFMAAAIPPPSYAKGWATFTSALITIGILTAFINDIALMVGCCFNIPDALTAITLVALGTSLPDTFASMQAARESDDADASITNVTGSNSVNVFLGLGLPWTVGSIYWAGQGATADWISSCCTTDFAKKGPSELLKNIGETGGFVVPAGELGASVALFSFEALIAIAVLAYRRKYLGGELGGPYKEAMKYSILLIVLWLCYVVISSIIMMPFETELGLARLGSVSIDLVEATLNKMNPANMAAAMSAIAGER